MEKGISFIKRNLNHPHFQVGILIILISCMYFITLKAVPFHPDEATYLYMSKDFKTLLTNPLSLPYHDGQAIDTRTHYRLMDSPLTRFYLGFARAITNTSDVENDWNWTATWQENLTAGNMPSSQVIFIGRLAILILFPLICYFVYQTANSLMSHWPAIFTMLLFAMNPLIILHYRRTMTEALLLFFSSWFFMIISNKKKHLFYLPVIFAFALNSKQIAIFLLPAYGIYFFWCLSQSSKQDWIKYFAAYLVIPILITYILNPVGWVQPIAAIRASISERSALIQGNEYFLQQTQPERSQQNIVERMLTVIYHTAYEPLALDDIGNYRKEQQTSFDLYNSNLFQNHSRNITMGTGYVILVLSAILLQWTQFWKQQKSLSLAWLNWIFIQIIFFSSLFGLSVLSSIYQRYVIILIPSTSLFIVWLLDSLVKNIKKQPV